jgi:hypothetical protein
MHSGVHPVPWCMGNLVFNVADSPTSAIICNKTVHLLPIIISILNIEYYLGLLTDILWSDFMHFLVGLTSKFYVSHFVIYFNSHKKLLFFILGIKLSNILLLFCTVINNCEFFFIIINTLP